MTVVEAAGNSGILLDNLNGTQNHHPFSTASRSGAIIVGAGCPPESADYASSGNGGNPRSRVVLSNYASNYGSEVDLQAYGLNVFTCGSGDTDSDPNDVNWSFTKSFAGTSSAAAIVAGCCTVAQSAFYQYTDNSQTLTPAKLKKTLVQTGIAQVARQDGEDVTSHHIGPLPSLKKALQKLVLRANLNNDHHTDIVWRHGLSGQNLFWYMSGSTVSAQAQTSGVPDPNWRIVSTEDFNADGNGDLLWQNTATGAVDMWGMNGTTPISDIHVADVAIAWKIEATSDFDGDGQPDILWRNSQTGENILWTMNGTTISSSIAFPTVADTSWHMVGAGDFTGDGWADILWRNASTGEDRVWG